MLAREPSERHREHLTSGIYDHAAGFAIEPIPQDFSATRAHRFAVDTDEDYRRLGAAADRLQDLHASAEQVAAWLATAGAGVP